MFAMQSNSRVLSWNLVKGMIFLTQDYALSVMSWV